MEAHTLAMFGMRPSSFTWFWRLLLTVQVLPRLRPRFRKRSFRFWNRSFQLLLPYRGLTVIFSITQLITGVLFFAFLARRRLPARRFTAHVIRRAGNGTREGLVPDMQRHGFALSGQHDILARIIFFTVTASRCTRHTANLIDTFGLLFGST